MAKKRVVKPEKRKTFWKSGTKARKQAAAKTPNKVRKLKVRKTTGRKKAGNLPEAIPAPTVHRPVPSVGAVEHAGIDLGLGLIVLPDPEASRKFLGELAQLNDRALDAQGRYQALKDATKQAKDKYDELAEQVITRLRQATHGSDLPLFANLDQREADQALMEAGPEGVQGDSDAPRDDDPGVEGAETPSALLDDDNPF